MNQTPKVSMLIPIYGVEKFIERSAISLFEQTYQNIEYIFVNDCTKDNSVVILKNGPKGDCPWRTDAAA